MIHSISFKNFCSFREWATIDFEINQKVSESDWNFVTPSGTKLNKVLALIGPNASGKTSLLKSIAFIQWFISSSFTSQEGEMSEIPLDQFEFTGTKNSISEFEIYFEIKRSLFKYYVSLNPKQVFSEVLSAKQGSRYSYLLKREWVKSKKKYELNQAPGLGVELKVLNNILRANVSAIASAEALKNPIISDITQYWREMITNVRRTGKSGNLQSGDDSQLYRAAEEYNKSPKLFKKARQILTSLDLGLSDVSLEKAVIKDKQKSESEEIYYPYGIHKIQNKKHILPMVFESSGSQNLFVLLHYLLSVLENGNLAVIDELEVDLHPHMIPSLLQLFSSTASNPHNSQLIFSCHSIEILKYLDKYQIGLVEKDSSLNSDFYRMDEIKGIRSNENIYSKYSSGAYGAVPNV